MSDVIDCSNCNGTGIDPASVKGLSLKCQFCGGVGLVGGEYGEPAEGDDVDGGWRQVDPADVPPVWEMPGARPGVCGQCQGYGTIFATGGGREQVARLAYLPCPACQG